MVRACRERLSEPLHLNLLSLFVLLFSSYRTKIAFDLVPRRHYAYGVLRAAEQAASHRLGVLTVLELGVATGRGLLNLCDVARKVSKLTGVRIEVYGFDTGAGMPPPRDYRDHPELYQADDFPMDRERLASLLPSNGKLIFGELRETLPAFMKRVRPDAPLGFVAVDIDYYSSAKDALTLFSDPDPLKYIPLPIIYFDDISMDSQNNWCGELLAIREFNDSAAMRKIEVDRFLRTRRIFKHASWIDQIYLLHIFDHPQRQPSAIRRLTKTYAPIGARVTKGPESGEITDFL
jgi:hypothetical protein